MTTDVDMINGGLSKISASRITRLDPAVTPLEKYMKSNYAGWKRSELTKRRWVCATEDDYVLTLSATLSNPTDGKKYKYGLPNDCLRPIRSKFTEWKQRGRFVFSAYATLKLDYVKNISENDFDPLLEEAFKARIAYESAEYVTQSSAKKEFAKGLYDEAISDAGKVNAFIIGAEDIQEDDDDFSWVSARYS